MHKQKTRPTITFLICYELRHVVLKKWIQRSPVIPLFSLCVVIIILKMNIHRKQIVFFFFFFFQTDSSVKGYLRMTGGRCLE